VQVTYLDAASFGPYLFPDGKRILFSSNYGDPKGREFDLWMIGVDGTGLERVTSSPGFDGFPMFSPDGKQLAFASNRNNAPGSRDTNVFVARWTDEPGKVEDTAAERIVTDARWLADPAREGRGVGTRGLEEAGAFVETRLRALGLQPVFGGGSYRQPFEVPMSVQGKVTLAVDGKPIEGARILAFSGDAKDLTGDLVLAGHGIQTDGWDDYAKLDVKGKIVLVRRFVPDDKAFSTSEATRRHGDLRRKAWLAREKGAKAMIVVDLPAKPRGAPAGWKPPDEAKLPSLAPDASGEAGLPAVIAPRAALEPIVAALEKKKTLPVTLTVAVTVEKKPAFNVAAKLAATGPSKGTIVVGAHYDHLGMGGHGSLAPDQVAVHHGADDNASGTATVLEIARALVADESPRTHDVVFGLFSGEERGVLGSNYFVKNAPPGLQPKDLVAMINLDMVGRVRGNKLDVTGHDTATELGALLQGSCDRARACPSCSSSRGPTRTTTSRATPPTSSTAPGWAR
jgi:hypothetical protein